MTDHNLASLPTLDLLGMLYSAQANYANAKSDRKRVTNESVSAIAARLVNVLETFDRDAVETFADALISGWEFDYSAYIGEALDRLADARILSR